MGFIIIVALITTYANSAPWWIYVIIIIGWICWDSMETKETVEVPKSDAPDIEKIKAEVRTEILTAMAREKINLDRRERAIKAEELKVSQLDHRSLKAVRNTLMKLHEARSTDQEYQSSSTCKDATSILQALNDVIEKRKAS